MILFAFALLGVAFASVDDGAPADRLEPFLLQDAAGRPVRSHGPEAGARGTVLGFFSPRDEGSADQAALLAELAGDDQNEGLRFLVVVPDRDVLDGEALEWGQELGLEQPVLMDPLQALSDRLGIRNLGTVVVVDAMDQVRYRGAIEGEEAYLLDALEAGLMEVEVAHPRSEGTGRRLVPLEERGGEVALHFHRDIAPIINAHCVSCHRDGQIGPMVLDDFEEVRGWAPMIAEVVQEGRMPPWNANPRHGDYKNARQLSETEKAALVHWARNGAPQGDPSEAPEAPVFEEVNWRIGTPDVVFQLPAEQEVPATGVVPYRYIMVDPEIDEDRWVQAIEVRNSSPEVTHHVLVYLVPEGMAWHQFMRSQRDLGRGLIAGIAPGTPPDILDPGTARRIPAGSQFLFQLHYTPNGRETTDMPQLAFRWADRAELEAEIISVGVTNFRIDIQPQLDDQEFHARHRMREEAVLLGMSPHMHSRGKSFRYELISGGEERVLLDVPAYDFNWQHTYMLREPLRAAPGDTFLLTGVYDNSEDNPFNPDPDARVRWGDQTWEEMFLGWLYFRVPLEAGVE